MTTTLLAQLSDPHIQAGSDDQGAAERLEAAVRAVLELRPHPHAVVLTGDLTEHGRPADYERVRELLAPLPMPVHVLAGNHDDRAALRAAFGLPGADAEPIQYTVDCGGLRVVLCDTIRPGRDDGRLDTERLGWLESALAAEPEAPTVVAMHHPPILTGIGPLDEIGLAAADRAGLAEVIARAPQVRRIVAGHVHRGAFGMLGRCGVFACPSTFLQARLEIGDGELELVWQPPAFALHAQLDGELVTHVQPISSP